MLHGSLSELSCLTPRFGTPHGIQGMNNQRMSESLQNDRAWNPAINPEMLLTVPQSRIVGCLGTLPESLEKIDRLFFGT